MPRLKNLNALVGLATFNPKSTVLKLLFGLCEAVFECLGLGFILPQTYTGPA